MWRPHHSTFTISTGTIRTGELLLNISFSHHNVKIPHSISVIIYKGELLILQNQCYRGKFMAYDTAQASGPDALKIAIKGWPGG